MSGGNLGSGREVSIRELARLISDATGYSGNAVWDTTLPNGQPRRMLDVSRAAREFGFRATTSVEEGLRKTLKWFATSKGTAASE